MSTIAVPADLLPILRENVLHHVGAVASEIEYQTMRRADDLEPDRIAAELDRIRRAADAYRDLRAADGAYPATAVALACERTIADTCSRIADDKLDGAELRGHRRVIACCEALRDRCLAEAA